MWSILTSPWFFVPMLILVGAIGCRYWEALLEGLLMCILYPIIIVGEWLRDVWRKFSRRSLVYRELECAAPLRIGSAALDGSTDHMVIILDEGERCMVPRRIVERLVRYEAELTRILVAESILGDPPPPRTSEEISPTRRERTIELN